MYILRMDILWIPASSNYFLGTKITRSGKILQGQEKIAQTCLTVSHVFFNICWLGVKVVFIGRISLLTVGMSEVRRWPIIGILDPIGIYHPDPQLQTNKRCKADRNRYMYNTDKLYWKLVWFYLRQNCEIGQFFLLALIKDIIWRKLHNKKNELT